MSLSVTGDLVVSATATFQVLWDALDVAPAPALEAVLGARLHAANYIDKAVPMPERAAHGWLSPAAMRLRRLAPVPVAETASAAGCPTTAVPIWSDHGDGVYTDDPRLLEVLTVETPWAFTTVDATQPTYDAAITGVCVEAGHYLVASIGETAPCVRKVGRIDSVPTAAELTAIDAFRADYITAVCSRCTSTWHATGGTSDFAPASAAAPAWRLGDVGEVGLVTNTVACPIQDCPGRLHFNVHQR